MNNKFLRIREILIIVLAIMGIAFWFVYRYWNIWLNRRIVMNEQVLQFKYDIFRDLLVLLLSLAAVIGYFLYLLLKLLLKKSINEHIQKSFSTLRGHIYITDGLRDYDRGDIERAIEYTEKALKENLSERDEIWAKNNLAYYYAMLYKNPEFSQFINKQRVLEFAEFVFKKYNPCIKEYAEPDWVETYVFVRSRFANTIEEIEEIIKFIEEIIKNPFLVTKKEDLEKTLTYLREKTQNSFQ